MKIPISSTDYYDAFPANDHVPGDVWVRLPTFGILPLPRCSALVITPACDLANRKVETLTYVPIVPVCTFLTSRAHFTELVRTTEGQLVTAGIPFTIRADAPGQVRAADIDATLSLLNDVFKTKKPGQKELDARTRAQSGLVILRSALNGTLPDNPATHLKILLGEKDFVSTCKRLVTNAYRTDIHFLPADGQQDEWSAIASHSVALFRYPLTIPLDLLDLSITATEENWDSALKEYATQFPCVSALVGSRPIKLLRVRPRFMSDLLTRFIALYGRLGRVDVGSPSEADEAED